ncbi:hypothetical protein NDU88_006236 [Pleurodeles waltl]|uniref:Uncharacterized protein n=1 Tax=Pleurodeles waltl TaxID=8319 RepID=A0AAV7LPZ0_PLEWA|nr:hypothetical protein NDU88_006236 [Pleurodeles waltl]
MFFWGPTGPSMPAQQNLGPDTNPVGCRGNEQPPRHVEVGMAEARAPHATTALDSVQSDQGKEAALQAAPLLTEVGTINKENGSSSVHPDEDFSDYSS